MLDDSGLNSRQKGSVTRALLAGPRNGQETVGELRAMSDLEIFSIHKIGKVSLYILRHLFGSQDERNSFSKPGVVIVK